MNDPRQLLRNFAHSGSMFFNLSDGQEATVRYFSAEIVPNNFDGGKTNLVRYHLEVDGERKMWDRPSRKLAEQMSEIPEGACISVRRVGKRNQTKYFIRKIKE